jgi:hypothetical protein
MKVDLELDWQQGESISIILRPLARLSKDTRSATAAFKMFA